jgi:hypothetical protein
MTWGIESHVIERFAAADVPGAKIPCVRDTQILKVHYPQWGSIATLLRHDDAIASRIDEQWIDYRRAAEKNGAPPPASLGVYSRS